MPCNESKLCTCGDECQQQQGAQCYWPDDEARAKIEAERNAEMWAEFPDAPAPDVALPGKRS